ncbi:MAG: hypothetical protein CVT49_02110 [candidate division Zixibacteria bacterium HGW-Zixibacteria-1]|nr:MAG: hypothetical protein CVT49_02110 [candidate division Zixibacteria bacterium HGW-Zixibacteria-1]
MNDMEKKIDANFFHLVVSLQMASMQQMGKIASPLSGKVEKNLDQARLSIDMLAMLAEKTDGNLTHEEKDLIDRVLFELRLNFVDETKKGDAGQKTEEKHEMEEKSENDSGKSQDTENEEDNKS